MASFTSRHKGSTIDDAVDRVLANGGGSGLFSFVIENGNLYVLTEGEQTHTTFAIIEGGILEVTVQ